MGSLRNINSVRVTSVETSSIASSSESYPKLYSRRYDITFVEASMGATSSNVIDMNGFSWTPARIDTPALGYKTADNAIEVMDVPLIGVDTSSSSGDIRRGWTFKSDD